jgi:hypothetical protein
VQSLEELSHATVEEAKDLASRPLSAAFLERVSSPGLSRPGIRLNQKFIQGRFTGLASNRP